MPRGKPKPPVSPEEIWEEFEKLAAKRGLSEKEIAALKAGKRVPDIFDRNTLNSIEVMGRLVKGERLKDLAEELDLTPQELRRILNAPRQQYAKMMANMSNQLILLGYESVEKMHEILEERPTDRQLNGIVSAIHILWKALGITKGDLQPADHAKTLKQTKDETRRLLKEVSGELESDDKELFLDEAGPADEDAVN